MCCGEASRPCATQPSAPDSAPTSLAACASEVTLTAMQGHAVAGAPLWMSVCALKCKGALLLLMAIGCSRLPSICHVPRHESD